MLFSFYNIDHPGTDIRARLLSEHKAYLARFADQMAFAGPLLAEDGKTPVGSLLVMDFDDRPAAEAFMASEPYGQSGLYQSVSIRAFENRWPQKAGFPETR
ncbi:MAG: YciI family protein [Lautropia sp.]|nr:YciI family protein [Lautropia sp.]